MTASYQRRRTAHGKTLRHLLLLGVGALLWSLTGALPAAAAAPAAGDGGVVFTYTAPDAGAVFLAGDFNGWNATDLALAKGDGGVWSVSVALDSGAYEYKFVVDGAWVEDPDNPRKVSDPFGGSNSVVEIAADGSVTAAGAAAAAAAPAATTAKAPEKFTVGPPQAVDGGVQFTYHDPNAGRVTLAGSFNGWNADELPLTGDGKGNWVIVHPLKEGKHEYKFVADGAWMADPENPDTQADPYGGANSLVTVGADGKLIAGAAADSGRPKANSTLNARLYVGGRYLTRFEFVKNMPVAGGDGTAVDPRMRLQRPSQTVDLNFDTQVSDLTDMFVRMRMDSDQNIIQNNVAGFLDEARLVVHPDNFTLRAFWNQEIYTGGDLLRSGGDIDLPGTILHDHLDAGKGAAGGLFSADPAGVHLEAYFANVHNQDYYNDPDLYDNVGEDRIGLRFSRRYGDLEVGVPFYAERSLVWLDFGTLVSQPSTGIPILDDHRRSGDSSTWYEVDSHRYDAGLDLRYDLNERWRLGAQGMYVNRLQSIVTGNESGQNNTNGSLDLPFLDRDGLLLLGQAAWAPREGLDLRLQHIHEDLGGGSPDERMIEYVYLPQDQANKNIYFTLTGAPAEAVTDSTDLTVNWSRGDREAELWLRRTSVDLDYGAAGGASPLDSTLTAVTEERLYLAGRVAAGSTSGRLGRGELEFGWRSRDLGAASRKDDSLEMILRLDRDVTRNTGLIADLRWVRYHVEGDGYDDDSDHFAPFVGMRYSPIRQLLVVLAYGVDPLDYSIDYNGRQTGRYLFRQQYLWDNPDATVQDAERHLAKARVITLRAQLTF